MNHHAGDPLADMISELREDDLERTARCIAGCHQAAAGRAERRGDDRAARFHRALASDVFRRLKGSRRMTDIPIKMLQNGLYRLDDDGQPEKRCAKCREWWPGDNEFFYKCVTRTDGLHAWCKSCCAAYARQKRVTA